MTNASNPPQTAGTERLPNTAAEAQRVLQRSAELLSQVSRDNAADVARSAELVAACLEAGGKLLLFGNGGSAAHAQHLAAEFIGRFVHDRRPLSAVALTTDTSALTAISNDYGFESVFERQVEALGRPGDLVIAISTSGNSPNVLRATARATSLGLTTVGLTGQGGGKLGSLVDLHIAVPATDTSRIQEGHAVIGHAICELVEQILGFATRGQQKE